MDVRTIAAASAFALLFLVGCSEEPVTAPTTDAYAAAQAQAKAGRARVNKASAKARANDNGGTPIEVESNLEDGFASVGEKYVYNATGKRDPFRSFQYTDDEAPVAGFGPLGDYELQQLSVVAVVWDTRKPRALIADPGGRSFIVHEGSQIGKNKGRVIHIGDNLLLVKETYVNFAGEQTTKDVEMRIRRSQGG